jgi:hypothetical protein
MNKNNEQVSQGINLNYHLTEKNNYTQLKAKTDRAVVAKIQAELVLPDDKILTVDISFDSNSGYNESTMMIWDDLGVEIAAAGFSKLYGEEFAKKIREAWQTKQHPDAPRKPTYLLVKKPKDKNSLPEVYKVCGIKEHKPHITPNNLFS